MLDELVADIRLLRGMIPGHARIILQVEQLPLAGAERLAHPQQLPFALPDGAVAEELPVDPVLRPPPDPAVA